MYNLNFTITIAVCLLVMGACASSSPPADRERPRPPSNTYTTAFPSENIYRELQHIQRSVKRISSTGIYVTYYFEDRFVTKNDLEKADLPRLSTRKTTNTESTAGTAISIFSNSNRIAMLTNAHVVSYPDTIISYIDREGVNAETYIASIKIKKNQNYLIYDLPNVGPLDVIALDERTDLALLRIKKNNFPELEAPPLDIKAGDAKDLRLGSFVYILGYPKGYTMITRGIVSEPNRNESGDFLTDALFNRGISGGIVLASRNSFNTLEWVGMTNNAVGQSSLYLIPDPLKTNDYRSFDAYTDSVFVEEKIQLNYGITQAIPINTIQSFLRQNADKLRRMGFPRAFN